MMNQVLIGFLCMRILKKEVYIFSSATLFRVGKNNGKMGGKISRGETIILYTNCFGASLFQYETVFDAEKCEKYTLEELNRSVHFVVFDKIVLLIPFIR